MRPLGALPLIVVLALLLLARRVLLACVLLTRRILLALRSFAVLPLEVLLTLRLLALLLLLSLALLNVGLLLAFLLFAPLLVLLLAERRRLLRPIVARPFHHRVLVRRHGLRARRRVWRGFDAGIVGRTIGAVRMGAHHRFIGIFLRRPTEVLVARSALRRHVGVYFRAPREMSG